MGWKGEAGQPRKESIIEESPPLFHVLSPLPPLSRSSVSRGATVVLPAMRLRTRWCSMFALREETMAASNKRITGRRASPRRNSVNHISSSVYPWVSFGSSFLIAVRSCCGILLGGIAFGYSNAIEPRVRFRCERLGNWRACFLAKCLQIVRPTLLTAQVLGI